MRLRGMMVGALAGLTVAACQQGFSIKDLKIEADQYPADYLDHDSLNPTLVTSRVLAQDDKFGGLTEIQLVGDQLVIADVEGPPFLHLIDRKTGRPIDAVGG